MRTGRESYLNPVAKRLACLALAEKRFLIRDIRSRIAIEDLIDEFHTGYQQGYLFLLLLL